MPGLGLEAASSRRPPTAARARSPRRRSRARGRRRARPGPRRRSRALEVARDRAACQGRSTTRRDLRCRRAAGRASRRAVAVLARVELDEVGAVVGRSRRRRPRPRASCREPAAPLGARRGLSRREDEAGQVGAGLGRGGDVLLARQPADLHERAGEQLRAASPPGRARASASSRRARRRRRRARPRRPARARRSRSRRRRRGRAAPPRRARAARAGRSRRSTGRGR